MKRSLRILIVDDNAERALALESGLDVQSHEVVARCGPKDDLRAILRTTEADVILASLSCPDRDVIEALRTSNEETPRPIAMFVDEPGSSMAVDAIRAGVSAYVVDGLAPKRVKPIVEIAVARFNEFQKLRLDLRRSQDALAERKLIDRAKGMLMQERGLSEADAYALMRKTAMRQGQKIVEVARSVISVTEMLKR